MKQPKKKATSSLDAQTDDMGLVRICQFVLAVLVVAILLTAILSIQQIQKRHEAYRTLQILKADLIKLKTEEHRLLIEQQTFSAAPEVFRRATTHLNMFLPNKENKEVISPKPTSTPNQEDTP